MMLYLGTSPVPAVVEQLNSRRIGLMCAPGGGAPPRSGWLWAADNGAFSEAWVEDKWLAWLRRPDLPRSGCLFAAVPDVVGNAEATRERWDRYAQVVRDARYPVAYVGQDGLTDDLVPWGEMDAFFVGGSTRWKQSQDAFDFADEARRRGCWVHVGRINSEARYLAWTGGIGGGDADSCDGTFLAFGPDTNLPRLLRWLDEHDANPQMAVTR